MFNINVWLESVAGLSIDEDNVVKPFRMGFTHTNIQPLADLADVPGRDFRHVAVLASVDINWDPQPGDVMTPSLSKTPNRQTPKFQAYRKTIKTWRLFIWNTVLPGNNRVILLLPQSVAHQLKGSPRLSTKTCYPAKATSPAPSIRLPVYIPLCQAWGGPHNFTTTDDVCPTQMDADRVGTAACRLLNKYLLPISETEFPDPVVYRSPFSGFRTLLEMLALTRAIPNFDFRTLRHVFQHNDMTYGFYCLSPTPGLSHDMRGGTKWAVKLPEFVLDCVDRDAQLWLKVQMDESSLPREALDAIPDPPGWFSFTPVDPA
ncbi:hypothetical protein C7974DRAFT_440909 [Boeremia exigua]|uniref:uncharacterized protein n=1 Tax=Boeremia exigua TaxID=749465 RepID=UPI001E8D9C00|nr:uncharacterized protein C7974DRAFT_440909 [Boeremia exigua]KAH6618580.1 hypothetical protein C7974DRAFT_440909 [Boeremia exigua]